MKIALIAPSPVPFVMGGAENLWTGWIAALNAQPGVEADLIKLPTPERDFWQIVDSYRRWSALDLAHFDRVISTKYPAWMVAHPDHHVFLQHKLRGLYDTWPAGLETRVGCDAPVVGRLLAALRGEGRGALGEIFAALDEVRAAQAGLPAGLFALPGALIRAVVHGLDRIGLSRTAIRRYAAISATVRDREDYFPPGAEVEVIHHPTLPRPQAVECPQVPQGAIFTASRLDGPKRLDWVVGAYLAAGVDVPLVIAGDGPCRAALERQAAGDPRIRFVGRLSDAELAGAYARALFVPFVPDREDYGLITLEALQAGKPVLTCSDAGGVTELVKDGENGLVTAPNVAALAEGMRRLVQDVGLREALASRAAASVAHIQWPALAAAFSRPWRRMVVVNTFAVYPAQSGGQLRLLHLYQRLARYAEITMVNLGPAGSAPLRRRLVAGLTEVVVPASAALQAFEQELGGRLRASCMDMAAMLKPELAPEWLAEIDKACEGADWVVASHPYGYPAIRQVWSGPVVYDAHNVERDLKAAIFPDAEDELAALARVEGACAGESAAVLCCSAEDAARMQALYGLAALPAVVPNGVDADSYPTLTTDARQALRARLGLSEAARVALFVGSWHGPNIDAVRALIELAPACPQINFVVLGSVCKAPALPAAPANVWLAGRVSDEMLRVWLAAADVGLNPMVSGSGTNLKMLEYAAAGLPILSTPFGGRGGILQPDEHFVAAEIDEFGPAIARMLADENRGMLEAMRQRARQRAVQQGDWRAIAGRMWAVVGMGLR